MEADGSRLNGPARAKDRRDGRRQSTATWVNRISALEGTVSPDHCPSFRDNSSSCRETGILVPQEISMDRHAFLAGGRSMDGVTAVSPSVEFILVVEGPLSDRIESKASWTVDDKSYIWRRDGLARCIIASLTGNKP
jgi:hypothetical protein